MYSYLIGKITEKTPASIVLEVNNVGYHIQISLNTYEAIVDKEQAKLFVHLAVRDDGLLLFGFAAEEERSLFLQLITVSGVGVNTARIILSSMSTIETIEAIATGNVTMLQRVKGIGVKTAQRIVVDLKDKMGKTLVQGVEKSGQVYNTSREEALSALLVLGFHKITVDKVLNRLLQQDASMSVEKLIKEALRVL